MSETLDRRTFGAAVAAAAGTMLTPAAAGAQHRPAARPTLEASPREHALAPLPFAPAALPGLSERLLSSHHQNNYGAAVRKLNEVRQQLAAADPAQAGPYWSLYGSLRAAELAARNSAHLHELYFANLAAGQSPPAELAALFNQRFSSLDALRAQLLGAAKASNGWVVLALDPSSRTLEVLLTESHAFGAWEAAPLLVLDLYEHAYALDFGANKAGYFDALWRNLAWGEVHARTTRALARL